MQFPSRPSCFGAAGKESLLKYYELELDMQRTHQQEFAARYSGVAGALRLTGNRVIPPPNDRVQK
ncbi:type VI secretion system baseplate subunit TssF [Janthinobacterium sp. RB2P8]|uniref:type VI secretion system baseplate subunit TssF n=1 Tax=Janthinobacterium sp. RB2P8 TaxID=3424191 RepID=UPI003F224AEA